MKKRATDKTWFPFWVDKWIFGSMRIEFNLEERAIWIDLLALASKDDGYIRANEETPYPIRQLAGMLMIPDDKLKKAIKKFIEKGKLIKRANGTLLVAKWEKYQFSESYARVKKHREKDVSNGKPLQGNKKALPYNIIEDKIIEDNKIEEPPTNINATQEKQIYNELCTVKGLGVKKRSVLMVYLKELSIEFPEIDYVYEMKKKVAWWLDNPLTKNSNVHLQIRNWFIIAQKGIDEVKRQRSVGAPRGKYTTKYPGTFLHEVYAVLRKQGKNFEKYAKLIFALNDAEAKEATATYKDTPADFIKFLEAKK